MLDSISLKFTELSDPLLVPAQGATLFVGPNNSGKSLVLREIEQDIIQHQTPATKILDGLEIVWMSEAGLNAQISEIDRIAPPNISPDNVYVRGFDQAGQLYIGQADRKALTAFMTDRRERRYITSQFLRMFLIRLDGRTRFALTNDRPRGDLLGPAQNILMQLFKDDPSREKVRDIVFEAFGVYFTIEQLSENLRIRLSAVKPDQNEQSWNEAARQFHANALHIAEASDGVKAFVGILCAVLSGDYRAILIDEPEAFLHPPLARKLGYQLTSNLKAGGTLMASTHSADFLMGCLQASPNVRVVRLEHSNGKSKGKIVDSTVLTKLFKAPLFRSANVISALFHDGVVVTESDNDRAFYAEIYNRLAEQETGYPSLLFVNAQNKQTIRDIIGPLRAFGVPAVAIADVDILKDGGGTWIGWLEAAQVPAVSHVSLGQQRASLHKLFVDQKIDMERGGVLQLAKSEQAAAMELFDYLSQYGIFVVPHGEVEAWLPDLGIVSKKASWTVEMLERLGSDPHDANYVRPRSGDVWDFTRQIVKWVREPQRKGTS